MTHVTYKIVEHDGGWAYTVNGVFSEPFPSRATALAAARPLAVEADRVTVAFPPDAAFVKKKAESNRELIQRALRGLTGRSRALGRSIVGGVSGL